MADLANVKVSTGNGRVNVMQAANKVGQKETIVNGNPVQTGGTVIKAQNTPARLTPITVIMANPSGDDVTFKIGDRDGTVASKFRLSGLSNPTGGTFTGEQLQNWLYNNPITIGFLNYKASSDATQFSEAVTQYLLESPRKRTVVELDEDILAGERNTQNNPLLNSVTFIDAPVASADGLITVVVKAGQTVSWSITPQAVGGF